MTVARHDDGPGSLARLAMIPLACLLLGQILLVATGTIAVLDGALLDTDAYMRLNRVVSLHEGGAWYDPTYPRINPPEGHVQHWTRPLDALLLAGAGVLAPLLGFRDALHVWGVAINPLFTAGALLALIWAAAPVVGRRGAILAGFAFLLQPTIISYGSAARPDHHGLLLMLFALLVALVPRVIVRPHEARAAWAAGAVTALAVWVSIEALTFAAVALATLGIYWLLGRPAMARANLRYAAAGALGLALALALERSPSGWAAVEGDRLSVLHLTLFGGIALFWAAALLAERTAAGALRSPRARMVAAALGVAAVLGGLRALFPDLGGGPLGPVDPLYRELRLTRILEIQPLVAWTDLVGNPAGAGSRLLSLAAFALVAAPYLAVRLARERGAAHPLWVLLAVGLAAFVPLSFYQVRWSGCMQLLALVPYAALLDAGLRRLERRLPPERLTVVRPLALVGGLLWALLLALPLARAEVAVVTRSCPLGDLGRFLARQGDGPRTIMTLADFGPELLYRTGHSVLSIPNHRPQPGFNATHRALASTDEGTARTLLDRHGVGWVLLCPGPPERAFYRAERSSGNLYRRLLEDRGPSWLRPVELPAPLSATFALFAVVPAEGSPAGGVDRTAQAGGRAE
ncbi:MAG TPA: hypothetical protein VFG47_17425 [Geminicoccaceae bacterium]|nr:hypothetical protein [Geminicoccaceae bacterium]